MTKASLRKLREMNLPIIELVQKGLITLGSVLVAKEDIVISVGEKVLKHRMYIVESCKKNQKNSTFNKLFLVSTWDLADKKNFLIATPQFVHLRLPTEEEYEKFLMCNTFLFKIGQIEASVQGLKELITETMYAV